MKKCDRLLLQSKSGITKCDRLLLQSASVLPRILESLAGCLTKLYASDFY